MYLLYNQEKSKIIYAHPRCGSSHLEKVAPLCGYKKTLIHNIDTTNQKLIYILRDPYHRWYSWFFGFIYLPEKRYKKQWDIQKTPDLWTLSDAKKWMQKFTELKKYDDHVNNLETLYNRDFGNLLFLNTEYVMMNDIDYYLNLSNKTRVKDESVDIRESTMNPIVVKYLKQQIHVNYQSDYDWLFSKKIWKK